MPQAKDYQRLILEGVKELPEADLKEIVDFVYFVRLRSLGKSPDELYQLLLQLELRQGSLASLKHLEEEFADYDRLYPQN